MLTAVSVLVVLGLVVVSHEFGHFIAAKWSGMRVRRFSVGFGPPIISRKWGETVYSVAWFPIGGFVDIVGLDPQEQDVADGFNSKPISRRFAVLLAGALMNILLALLVFSVIGKMFGVAVESQPVVEKVIRAQAEESGLLPGDRIVAVNGQPVSDVAQIRQAIQAAQDGRLGMQVERGGNTFSLAVKAKREKQTFLTDELEKGQRLIASMTLPHWDDTGLHLSAFSLVEQEIAVVGISFHALTRPAGFLEGISDGLKRTFNATVLVFASLKVMILGEVPLSQAKGPVGIVQVVGEAAHAGLYAFLSGLAMISVNIAILNIIPFPALDGGRLALLSIEAIRRRPLDRKKEAYVHLVGLAILILLIVAITINDLLQLFHPGK